MSDPGKKERRLTVQEPPESNGGSDDWSNKRESLSEKRKEKRRSGSFWGGWRSATVSDKKPSKTAPLKAGGSGFLSFRRKEVQQTENGSDEENNTPEEPVDEPRPTKPALPPLPSRDGRPRGPTFSDQWSPRDYPEGVTSPKSVEQPATTQPEAPVTATSNPSTDDVRPPVKKLPTPKKPLPTPKKPLPKPPPEAAAKPKTSPKTKPKTPKGKDKKDKEKDKKDKKEKDPDAKSWRIQRGRSFGGRNRSETKEKAEQERKKNRLTKNTDEKLGEALIEAAMLGKPEELTRLLDLGADTAFVDSNGYTALHWAASNGQEACLTLLIDRGANINAVDYLNWTPLHYAVFSGQQSKSKAHVRVVEMLLAAGADIDKKNNKGKKAVDLTTNKTVIAMLKRKRSSSSVASKYSSLFKRKAKSDTSTQTKVATPSTPTTAKGKAQAVKAAVSQSKDPETEAFFNLQMKAIERWEEMIKAKERAVWNKEEELYAVEKGLKMDVIKLKRVVEEDRAREATYKKRLEEVEKFEQMKKEKEGLLLEQQREKLVNSVDYAELDLGECLGGGASAKVYKAKWRGDMVAVKQICFDDPLTTEEFAVSAFQRETVLLGQMRHVNIVLLMGVCVEPPNLCLIMEQMTRGDLFSLLHRQKDNIVPWDLRLQITLDIARGMNYLHRMSPAMIHRDLKSKNVLLDDTFRAKLADFGTTRIKQETLLHTQSNLGTPAWMAPECLRGEDFDEKSDIYSFGVVLYEILERKVPWENRELVQIIGSVGFQGHRLPLPDQVPYGCPEGFLNLIQCCWAQTPSERPSFGHILPYLRTWILESATVF